MTPTLATRRLVLRHLTKAMQRHVDWLRDPAVVKFSEARHITHTLATCLRYIQRVERTGHIWAIYEAETDQHIGNLTAIIDRPNNVADVGILIGVSECWRRGYGTEAWKEVSSWLLDKEGGNLRKLEAGCMKTNEGMIKVLRNAGFGFEAERPAHFLMGSSPVAAVYYSRYQ